MAKIIIGLSGGVDSAVAAYLLKKEGHEVIGLTLRTWEAEDGGESRCCEIDDAWHIARRLDIPYHTLNCLSAFREHVTQPFIREYLQGHTPNPCIECNRYVKWERMLYMADVLSADGIATGHYASVERLSNGRYTVSEAQHPEKDQTYMLWKLTQEQLSRTFMPLSSYAKEEVREIAREIGLTVASKPDSQEICFVPDGHYSAFIDRYAEAPVPGEGHFTDENGTVLGTHKGITHYTVGQRKGLGIAMGHPVFVKEIRAAENEVVLSGNASLFHREILLKDVNWLAVSSLPAGAQLPCLAKIRYQHKKQPACLTHAGDGTIRLVFEEPVRAAAPGQSAVFYDAEDRVIGGGIIVGAK